MEGGWSGGRKVGVLGRWLLSGYVEYDPLCLGCNEVVIRNPYLVLGRAFSRPHGRLIKTNLLASTTRNRTAEEADRVNPKEL